MVEHTKINSETFFFKVQKVHIWVKVIYTQTLPVNCQLSIVNQLIEQM